MKTKVLDGEQIFQLAVSGQLETHHIQRLLDEEVPEDQQLEYKRFGGQKTSVAGALKDITAFANGLGGVVLLGIEEDKNSIGNVPKSISGVEGDKIPDESHLATRLGSLRQFMTVAPRFGTHDVNGKTVWSVVIERSDSVVPHVTKQSQFVYALRVGEASYDCPDYLLADLLIGRRQRLQIHIQTRDVSFEWSNHYVRPVLRFRCENLGLRIESGCRIGSIAPRLFDYPEQFDKELFQYQRHCEVHLSSRSLAKNPMTSRPAPMLIAPVHLQWPGQQEFGPLDEIEGSLQLTDIPRCGAILEAGIYFVAADRAPVWFQFRAEIHADAVPGEEVLVTDLTLEPVQRPRVALSPPSRLRARVADVAWLTKEQQGLLPPE